MEGTGVREEVRSWGRCGRGVMGQVWGSEGIKLHPRLCQGGGVCGCEEIKLSGRCVGALY